MKNRPKLLVAALVAVAAPALATQVIERTTTYHDGVPVAVEETILTDAVVAAPAPVIAPEEVVSPLQPVSAPLPTDSITVETQRLTEDEVIQRDVMEMLRNNPRLSGKIGVEAEDRVVRLSGVVTTPGQARSAARDAYSVQNVRYVMNELRTKVGGMP